MEKIRFNNSDTIYECNLLYVKNNVYKIIFSTTLPSVEILLSGFVLLNEYNLDVMSDFSDYTTKYKDTEEDNSVFLSTGEIFNSSLSSDVMDTDKKEEEKELTDEEKEVLKVAELEQVKILKIEEMSKACETAIENGILIDDKQYSYTIQDQSNMLNAMNLAKETELKIPYHANGESCSLYTFDEIVAIYMQEQMNLTMYQTYFNQLKLYIESITDIDKIEDVRAIVFGDHLTGIYLDTYNMIMEQGNKVMQKLISLESINSTDNEITEE